MNIRSIGIVTVNFNSFNDTFELIKSIEKISYKDFSMYIVDNGSKNNEYSKLLDLKKNIHSFNCEVLHSKENLGFAGGYNLGILRALSDRNDGILILSNDTTVEINFLTELVKTANNNNNVGIVGGKIFYFDRPDILWTVGGKVNRWFGSKYFGNNKLDNGQFDNISISHVSGCMALIPRETLLNIGLFDESYFFRGEEWDLCFRIKKNGLNAFLSKNSKIFHKVSKSVSRYSKFDLYCAYRSKLLFVSKFQPKFIAWLWIKIFKRILIYKYFYFSKSAKSRELDFMTKGEYNELINKVYSDFYSKIPITSNYLKRILS